ncbi:TetR/AcrR family transcriptional regulator [Pseudomonas sp. S33]|uniref:TetR/AcrR family transcriptional regulator n=1 Tax=unclassified Pseudomonas TaxID=196821 RepID=UPI00190B051D|nr:MULTISPECIES: TetR/AcrR family transcriptional regulator [unclassified Pseudomonas]MBJ9993777.1 TetR/AcrR family transcriptional regulator [Pseudomonas sp. S33]
MTTSKKPSESAIAIRRREQVLSAAAECVRREGFHRTSMSQISAAAGMSPGHIHHFFGGKEGIVAGIVARERSELGQLIENVQEATRNSDAISAIISVFPTSAAWYMDTGNASLSMEILAESGRNPEVAKLVHENDDEVRGTFHELLGGASPDVKFRCEIIAALLEGLSARALRNTESASVVDQHMLQSVVRYILTLEKSE